MKISRHSDEAASEAGYSSGRGAAPLKLVEDDEQQMQLAALLVKRPAAKRK